MKKKFIKTPLVGVLVHGAKDVGTRTVNLLMGEHAGEYVRGDIMDANAVIQAFDEIKGSVDTDRDSLEEIVDEIHNLRDATDQSFEIFLEKAEEETANRIQGDKILDLKIDQKEEESKERDNILQLNIDTEKQERVNSDTQLRNDLTTALNEQVDTLNTAISAKLDAGSYIPYDKTDTSAYKTDKKIKVSDASQYTTVIGTDAVANFLNGLESASFFINSGRVEGYDDYMSYSLSGSNGVHIISNYRDVCLSPNFLSVKTTNNDEDKNIFRIDGTHFKIGDKINDSFVVEINANGIEFRNRKNTEVPVADGSGFADLNNYVLKSVYDEKIVALEARIAALEAKHPEAAA